MDQNDSATNDLQIEYLPNDGGVRVNGQWFVSLERYFQKREEELKERANTTESQ